VGSAGRVGLLLDSGRPCTGPVYEEGKSVRKLSVMPGMNADIFKYVMK
jgi:hypothetical protein